MPSWRRVPLRISRFPQRVSQRAPALARIRRPTLVVNAVLVALLLVGGFFSYRTIAVADTATASSSGTGRAVPVTLGTVTSSVSASGTVQSASTANANFATSGTVTEIDVKVGDTVTAGQVLAKVNPTSAQEQLSAAQANLTSAQQSLSRAQSATTVDAATVAAAQAQVTTAQNNVNSAQRALDGTTLTAPMAGTVVAVNGTVGGSSGGSSGSSGTGSSGSGAGNGGAGNSGAGNSGAGNGGNGATGGAGNGGAGNSGSSSSSSSSSSTGTGFIQLADLTKMQVSASFAEADATKLKTGQTAAVTWAALSGARATGKIATIAPTATTQNNVNSYAVTVSLDTLPTGIRIGQTVTVLVTVAQADNVIRVPAAAVRGTGQRHTVQVVDPDGKQEVRAVQVGVQGDQFVEVTSGLQVGDRVALNLQTTAGTGTGGANRFGGGGFGGGGFGGGGLGGAGGAGGARGGGNRGGGGGG